jgi:lipoyl(octanoyl) transferase
MDLTPFHAIDPCGYPGLRVTHARELGIAAPVAALSADLVRMLEDRLQ